MIPSAPLTRPNDKSTATNAPPPLTYFMDFIGLPFIRLITAMPIETAVIPNTPAVMDWLRPRAEAAEVSRVKGSNLASKGFGLWSFCPSQMKNVLRAPAFPLAGKVAAKRSDGGGAGSALLRDNQ
jgi:hypothetical protein